jgi:hypothetical protein
MTPAERAKMARLEARIQDLERAMRTIPARFQQSPSDAPTVLRMDRGNTLLTLGSTVWYGVKLNTSVTPLTELPAVTPVSLTTYADGIGYGAVTRGGLPVGGNVWIVNRLVQAANGVQYSAAMTSHIAEAQYITSFRKVLMNVAGGAQAHAYLPAWVA